MARFQDSTCSTTILLEVWGNETHDAQNRSLLVYNMKRPQLVSPGSLNRMLQAANEAWEHCDFQQCLDLLERASRLDPANPRILLQLGQSYGLRYDYAAAERCFEKALRVASRKTEALATVGQISADFASHQLAEHYFQRTLEQKDASPEILARLAEFYERLRHTEHASKLVDPCVVIFQVIILLVSSE
jgi:tetratricopeptide (TPR) repeat protein